jgi:hypothetical protein
MYDSNMRYYDFSFPHTPMPDPLAEKYYSLSPYSWVANNPMKYVDYRGDSISVVAIQAYDKANGTNYLQIIMNDLQTVTGLTYSVSSTGMLVYDQDTKGNAIIAQDNKGNSIGSETARNHMADIIGKTDIINAGIIPESINKGSQGGGNALWLKPSQINAFISGAKNIDNKTLGWGMTFIHESYHTTIGGGLSDAPYNSGPVVTKMNTIRAELNAKGGNYGQRIDYISTPVGFRNAVLPFNNAASRTLNSIGVIPVGSPYIITKW